jgi:hypothetical protein
MYILLKRINAHLKGLTRDRSDFQQRYDFQSELHVDNLNQIEMIIQSELNYLTKENEKLVRVGSRRFKMRRQRLKTTSATDSVASCDLIKKVENF